MQYIISHKPSQACPYDDLFRMPDTKLLLASWLNGTPDEFLSRQAENGMPLPQPPELSQYTHTLHCARHSLFRHGAEPPLGLRTKQHHALHAQQQHCSKVVAAMRQPDRASAVMSE